MLLLKATGQVPHGGGARLDPHAPEAVTLARWIAQEADPTSPDAEAPLVRLEVVPDRITLKSGESASIRAVAHWQDGTRVDVTRLTRFESTAPGLSEVNAAGTIRAGDRLGVGAVLVRFGPDVAVGRVVVATGRGVRNSVPVETSQVDRLVLTGLDELGVRASPAASAAEYARRSSLDLTGRLPDPAEVARFETDSDPDRRGRWVDQLLNQPAHADLFALKWSALLRNRRTLGELSKPATFRFHAWVRQCLAENVPVDRFVRAIVAGQGVATQNPAVEWYRLVPDRDARAEDVAQVFLGVRIGCARCHRHPTERWMQADHADFARFFDRVEAKQTRDLNAFRVFHRGGDSPAIDSETPRVLGGANRVDLPSEIDPRGALADWIADPGNPLLARSVVNRTWKHFFGQGLVEPEDDLRPTNPASNQELLNALAADFASHGYNYRRLIRLIATSDAYARSSRSGETDATMIDPSLGRQFAPRPLPAEVLLDAIGDVTGSPTHFAGVPAQTRSVALPDDGFPSRFLDAFGRPERRTACECERRSEPDLTQALFLLNSVEVEARLADPQGRAARYASRDGRADIVKLDELYRVALSRPPDAAEVARCRAFLDERRTTGRLAEGWQDLIWAILNTSEFLSNH